MEQHSMAASEDASFKEKRDADGDQAAQVSVISQNSLPGPGDAVGDGGLRGWLIVLGV